MRLHFLFLAVMFLGLNSVIQAKDELDFTVFLQRDSVEGFNDGDYYGSGVIANDGAKLYIVTSAHIAQQMDSSAYLICNGEKGNSLKIYFQDLNINGDIQWHYHEFADLAILVIDKKSTFRKALKKIAIDSKRFIEEGEDVVVGNDVKLFGFPSAYGVGDVLNPFMYKSNIVNEVLPFQTLSYGEMCDFVCIQACTTKGNNGGPVFSLENNVITIVGFVHGSLWDNDRNKDVIFDLVTPAYYFFDMIDKN